MKLSLAAFIVLFFCTSCVTPATSTNDNVEQASSQTQEDTKKQDTKDFYTQLENQVQDVKSVYLPSSLPAIKVNDTVFQLEVLISEYVQKMAFYDAQSFIELKSTQPPQSCQKLMLIQRDIKNRKTEMVKLTDALSKGKKFDPLFTTAGFAMNVRVDPLLKIKSLYYILPIKNNVDEKLLEYYISMYGYPKEVSIPNASKGFIWGLEYNDTKYFLILANYSLPDVKNPKKTSNFSQIIAYRKDSSCKDS